MLYFPNQEQNADGSFPCKPCPQPFGVEKLFGLAGKGVSGSKKRERVPLGVCKLSPEGLLEMAQVFFAVRHGSPPNFIFQETLEQAGIAGILCGYCIRVADMGGRIPWVIDYSAKAGRSPQQPAVMELLPGLTPRISSCRAASLKTRTNPEAGV